MLLFVRVLDRGSYKSAPLVADIEDLTYVLMFYSFVMDVITFSENSGLSNLLHGAISLPDVTSYDNIIYLW